MAKPKIMTEIDELKKLFNLFEITYDENDKVKSISIETSNFQIQDNIIGYNDLSETSLISKTIINNNTVLKGNSNVINAYSSDGILNGQTRNIHISTEIPKNNDGQVGDLWFVIPSPTSP